MQSVFKTVPAALLGIGLLVLEPQAKPSVAFLGIDPATDPRFSKSLSGLIHQDLAADTALSSLSPRAVESFLARSEMDVPWVGPADLADLKKGLKANYYALGWLEPLAVDNKRVWWMPWSVRSRWSQVLRLRILDGGTGETIYDAKVPVEIPEKHFLNRPTWDPARSAPVERDGHARRMLPRLSAETAKTLSKVLVDKAQAQTTAAGANAAPAAK